MSGKILDEDIESIENKHLKNRLINQDNASLISGNTSIRFTENTANQSQNGGNSSWIGRICSSVQYSFRAGGINGSILSLVTAILGSGTVTLPYLAAKNGIVLSVLLIIFGAWISYYWAMLLVTCAEKVGSDKYETFAQYWYGRKFAIFTGWLNLFTLIGFDISYIVFIKTLVPHILEVILKKDNVPSILGSDVWKGQLVWASIYTVWVLIPLSLPRKAGALRFSSMFGVTCTFYLVLCLIFLFLVDRSLVPSMNDKFKAAEYFIVSYDGLVYAIPFVVFAFMYQPNIPMVYRELENKDYQSMNKVVIIGSGSVVIFYMITAAVGYLGLVGDPRIDVLLMKNNVLEVEYENWAFTIAIIGVLFTVFAAAPMSILPAKDTFEELVYPQKIMSWRVNAIVTVVMCLICYIFAIVIPGIGDAITILGWTTNPMIGFILPIIFYLKIERNPPILTKIISLSILVFVIALSIMGMVLFIKDKIKE